MPAILATLRDAVTLLIDPWLFMAFSASHIPITVRSLISQGDYYSFFSPSAFCEALFGQFWANAGPQVRKNTEERVIPLLEGRVRDGVVTSEVVSPPVSGVVIEIGAGSGMWADIFSKINTGGSATAATAVSGDDNDSVSGVRRRMAGSGITKIYGVEPNPESVKALRQRVKDLGLDDIYEVMPVGIESLDDPNAWPGKHIEPGSVDSIVTILCLCSIPDQEANVKALYKLLKPGGRWYVFEHVKATRGGPLMKLYQRFVNLAWSWFIGSCRLCCDTLTSLKKAGPWTEMNISQPPAEPPYKVLPHIFGILKK